MQQLTRFHLTLHACMVPLVPMVAELLRLQLELAPLLLVVNDIVRQSARSFFQFLSQFYLICNCLLLFFTSLGMSLLPSIFCVDNRTVDS